MAVRLFGALLSATLIWKWWSRKVIRLFNALLIFDTLEYLLFCKRGSLRSQKNLVHNTFQYLYLWQTWLALLAIESSTQHLLMFVSMANVARFARKRI